MCWCRHVRDVFDNSLVWKNYIIRTYETRGSVKFKQASMKGTFILRQERKFFYKFSLKLMCVDVNNATFSSVKRDTLGANGRNILFLIYVE